MYLSISKRAILEAEYIVENNSTVRSTAKVFNVGKSTVHKDLCVILPELDIELYNKVRKVLNLNLKERHIRGGLATKNKFKK